MSADARCAGKTGHYFTNWSTTYSCQPELFFEPETTKEIQQILALAQEKGKKVKVVGNGHSPSDLACTTDYMISLGRYNKVLSIDKDKQQITVQGGCLLKELNEKVLPSHGLAFSVLGTVSELTAAGVICTGTHGTGAQYGIMSTFVVALDLMTSSGEIMHISKEENSELLPAAVLSLGALGVILTVTLQCEPAFNLLEKRYPDTLKNVLENLEDIVTSSERFHVEVFPYTDGVACVHAAKTTQDPTPEPQGLLNSVLATVLGFPGMMFMFWICTFFPSLMPSVSRFFYRYLYGCPTERVASGQKVQTIKGLPTTIATEWAVARENMGTALTELQSWITKSGFPAHFPINCRFVKQEDVSLSPAYGRDTCYIGLKMFRPYNKDVQHEKYRKAFEPIMASVGGRPHWGKNHEYSYKELERLYPKWGEFCSVRQQLDPSGMFLNSRLRRIFNAS